MNRFSILIIYGLLISCVSNKQVFDTEFLPTNNLKLKDAVSYEKKIESVDKTPIQHISTDPGVMVEELLHQWGDRRVSLLNDLDYPHIGNWYVYRFALFFRLLTLVIK